MQGSGRMKRIALLGLVALFAVAARAQEARNAVYFELGGSAIVPSLNYERRLTERWWGRIGASYVVGQTEDDTDSTFVVPLTVSSVSHPAANHHLELGGGITILAGDEQDLYDLGEEEEDELSTLFVTGLVGYRYQKPDGGFQFRAAFTPAAYDGGVLPWLGISFGYAW